MKTLSKAVFIFLLLLAISCKDDIPRPEPIKKLPLPAKVSEGINIINNSTVTFVLYDKDKNGVHKDFAHVIGDFNNWEPTKDEKSQMNRDDASGCWWLTVSGLDPAKEYAF